MYTMIINKHALHLEISLFTIFLIFEFDKSVLQTVARPFVSYDFT